MAQNLWPIIPGETPIDLSWLTAKVRARGIANRGELSALEAENISRVVIKYLAAQPSAHLAPFDYTWCLKVHAEMFCDVWQWAGILRQRDLNIGVPFFNIRGDLYGLLKDLQSWPTFNMPLIEQAARLHHRAVAIHPFPNGNGRWSRMLANIWLRRNGSPLIDWPEDTMGQRGTIREEYIATIKEADAGDYEPLIALHRRFVKSAHRA